MLHKRCIILPFSVEHDPELERAELASRSSKATPQNMDPNIEIIAMTVVMIAF